MEQEKRLIETKKISSDLKINILMSLDQTTMFLDIFYKEGKFRVQKSFNNNIFGMKSPSTRVTTADSSINGYAHYQNWELSVIDYYLMLSVRNDVLKINSEDEYYRFVDQIYSEMGHNYSNQLKSIIIQLKLDELEPTTNTHKSSHKKYPVKKKHK